MAIQYLQRLVTVYYKDNPEKPTATFVPVNTALPMAKPTAPLIARPTAAPIKKRCRLAKTNTTKQAKKSYTSFLLDLFRFFSFDSCLNSEVFHQTHLGSFGFPPQYPTGLEDFHQLISYLPHCAHRTRSMISRNLVFFFLIFLLIGRKFFHPFHKSNTKQC